MARDASKNLQLSVSVEYNVYNWKWFEGNVENAIDAVLEAYGIAVKQEVDQFIGNDNTGPTKGPGPHPHRTGTIDNEGKPYNWEWEDTGQLSASVEWKIKGRGFLRTVEIFNNPIVVNGNIVDYGTFLEVGWHPVIRGKDGQMRPTGRFYAYPWLSTSLNNVNARVLSEIPKQFRKSIDSIPMMQVFGKARSDGGYGMRVQQNKFVISENISSAVVGHLRRPSEPLRGWLAVVPGSRNVPQIPGIRSRREINRLLNKMDADRYASRSSSFRNANPPPKRRMPS